MKRIRDCILPVAIAAALFISEGAIAVTTGLDFAGGCPEGGTPFCTSTMDSNATEEKVAELLGLDVSLVTLVGAIDDTNPTNPNFAISGIGSQSGSWSVSNPDITHLAFKSNGYFILGEVTAVSGLWMNDTSAPASWDLSLVDCLATICGVARPYVDADFQTMGGTVADLSNVRAFTVIPVPAAVWLFGSALVLLGWVRRSV